MPEKLTINLPEIAFSGQSASALAAKRAYDLHDPSFLPAGYEPLPDELEIVSLQTWRQSPWTIPGGCYGDVTFAVDPQGRYCYETSFPAIEDGHPRLLKFLGALIIEPGATRLSAPFTHEPPVIYRRGDRLIAAPETNNHSLGGESYSVFVGIGIRRVSGGDFPMKPGVVWAVPINDAVEGGPPYCIRNVVPSIATGGSIVEVNLKAGGYGCTYRNASVGIQASGPNMIAPPVPLLLNGQPVNALTLPPNGSAVVTAPLATQPGQSLLVNICFEGSRGYKRVSPIGADCWWSADFDSHAQATMGGTVSHAPRRTHGFDCVRVLP